MAEPENLTEELDAMSLPKGWTHEKLIREAHQTGIKIRKLTAASGMTVLGPKEVEHMSSLLGYLAKHSIAMREAYLEARAK